MRRNRGRIASVLMAMVVGACSDSTKPEPVGTIDLPAQPGEIEVAQSLEFTATLRGLDGAVLVGSPVRFFVEAGRISPTETQSDAQGLVRATWTLGPRAGAQTLRVEATGRVASFTVDAGPAAPSAFHAVSGSTQTGPIGEPLPDPFVVRVVDDFGNPVPGFPVEFAVTIGTGTLEPAATTTDASGEASTILLLGTALGRVEVAALGVGIEPVAFEAMATAGPPASARTEGGDQVGPVGETLPTPLVVDVQDLAGNPVSGAILTVRPVSGGGSVAPTQPVTDSLGRASLSWTLGPTAGEQRLEVQVPGLATLPVVATATPGPAVGIVATAGQNQSGPASTPLPAPLAITATDRFGNLVPDVPIAWTVVGGAGSLAATTPHTDAVGRATAVWTLGPTVGGNSARAALPDGTSTTFLATATSGPPATVEIVQGDGQTGTVAEALPVTPVVRVRDAGGNAVPGATVTFSAAQGGIAAPTVVTDGDGLADGGTWTLGQSAGLQSLTVTVFGVTPRTLTATATPGPAASLVVHAGDGQVATAGTPVAVAPAARVLDGYGNGVAGVTVQFAVTNGGGSLTGPNPISDATGVARVGGWTLGTTSGANGLSADATGLSTVLFSATGTSPPTGGFDIDLQWAGSVPGSVQSAMGTAAARWEAVVTGDLANVTTSLAAGACGVGHAAYSGLVDDLVVFVEVTSIDGAGGTLASAGPCLVRGGTFLPIFGVIRIDDADVSGLVASGGLTDVLIHELGHVLGIGIFWSSAGILQGAGGADPYYTGPAGVAQYQAAGGTYTGGVPVENTGGTGTRDAHWRESLLGTEVMTGYINLGTSNPLSVISVGALADLGFSVNYGAADGFAASAPAAAAGASVGEVLRLEELPFPPPRVLPR